MRIDYRFISCSRVGVVVFGLLLFFYPTVVASTVTVVTDEAAFNAAVNPNKTASFNIFPTGFDLPSQLILDDVTVENTLAGNSIIFGPGPLGFTTNFLSMDVQDGGNNVIITFPLGTGGAGMKIASVPLVTVIATDSDGVALSIPFSSTSPTCVRPTFVDCVRFLGFTSPAGIRSIRITSPFDPNRLPIVNIGNIHYRVGALALPDLSITSIEPVQVVFGPDIDIPPDGETDLVLNKSLAVLVTVHVNNLGALQSSVLVDLVFQGVTATRGFQPSDPDGSGNVELTFNLLPTQTGLGQEIIARVDPGGAVTETNEANNSRSRRVSVRETRIPHIPYVQITDCLLPFIPPSCYGPLSPAAATEAFNRSLELIEATYPVSEVQSEMKFSFLGDGIPLEGLLNDMRKAFRIGKRTDPMAERVVALVPSDYFSYHFKGGIAGYAHPDTDAVLASVDFWSTPAHEIGHTLGLHQPTGWTGPGEEYKTATGPNSRGNCAAGFWVALNLPIPEGLCFMGSVPQTAQRTLTFPSSCDFGPQTNRHIWIDNADYRALFLRLKQANDPAILIVTGSVSEDGTVELDPWYMAENGTSTARNEGDYSIVLVGPDGQTVASHKFSVTFFAQFEFEPTPLPIDSSPFAFSLPMPPGLFAVRIKLGPAILVEFDLSTKLLLDAVDSIPTRGFVRNADERRRALRNKAEAIGKMINTHNFFGAEAKLENDLKKHINQWLLDDYPIESPLEFSKNEMLDLVDEIILRLLAAQ